MAIPPLPSPLDRITANSKHLAAVGGIRGTLVAIGYRAELCVRGKLIGQSGIVAIVASSIAATGQQPTIAAILAYCRLVDAVRQPRSMAPIVKISTGKSRRRVA